MELSAVPDPGQDKSGASGDQQQGSLGDIIYTPPPLEGEHLPKTIIGLIALSPHEYGGDQVGPVISAVIRDSQADKERLRQHIAGIQARLDQTNSELVEQRLANARFEVELRVATKRTLLEKSVAFLCPVAFSIGIELYRNNNQLWMPLVAIGVVLIASLLLPLKGKRS